MKAPRRLGRLLAALPLAACAAAPALPERCDLRLSGGRVIDGSGAPPRAADVLVVGDRITAVVDAGAADHVVAAREVDASGMVVTPGFVDVHAHGDPLRTPQFANFTAMGVTTVCLGLDGSSPDRGPLADWLAAVARRRPAPNIAAFVGHGSARQRVAADRAAPLDAAQRTALADAIERDLRAGAFGLSTGLEYTPGRFADAAELAAAAAPVGAVGALVASHLRSEDDAAVLDALRELLTQCRTSGAAAHLSHAKIVYADDPDRAEAVLELLADARASGLRATADVYPYTASYTGLSILFPTWALPPHDYDAVVAARRDELAAWLHRRVMARNGPEAMLFGSGEFAGRSLAAAARARDVPFAELLVELGPRGGSAAYFVMNTAVMERLLLDPHVMVASDGSPTMRHPRGHGTFAKVIREFVVERELLALSEAVRKMTALPARTLGMPERGRVEAGRIADLLVFDPAAVRDRATFTAPFVRAVGFHHVIVSGRFVVEAGEPTGARPGRVLRRDWSAVPRAAPNSATRQPTNAQRRRRRSTPD